MLCFSSTFINSSCRGHPEQLGSRGSQIEQLCSRGSQIGQLGSRGSQIEQLDSRGNLYEQLYDSRGQLFEQLGSRSGQFEQLCNSSSFQFEQLGSWSNQAAAGGTLDRRQAAIPGQRKLSGVQGSTGGFYGSTGGGHGSFGDMMRSTGSVHGSTGGAHGISGGLHGGTGDVHGSAGGMLGSTGGPPRNSVTVFDGAECFPRQKPLSSGQRSAGKGAEQTECRTQPTITLRRKGAELKKGQDSLRAYKYNFEYCSNLGHKVHE